MLDRFDRDLLNAVQRDDSRTAESLAAIEERLNGEDGLGAIFPPMVAHMIKIGEETGELEKMLGKIADFYEDEVDSSIATLTSVIEPLMMIGVGMVVGVIIISMYMPMFKLLTLIQ